MIGAGHGAKETPMFASVGIHTAKSRSTMNHKIIEVMYLI